MLPNDRRARPIVPVADPGADSIAQRRFNPGRASKTKSRMCLLGDHLKSLMIIIS